MKKTKGILPDFDLLSAPLSGTNLIEASAGTGKTYAITGLFLRLLLEKNLSLNEILVVTFTEAATQELKDRIRSRLRQAVRAFSGKLTEDLFLNDLAERNKSPDTALKVLKESLRAFDQAAIFTIHGFCRQMLQKHAFESGTLFDTEILADLSNITKEIGDDFWRNNFYRASPLFVRYAMESRFRPTRLLLLLGGRIAQPYLKIIPRVEIPDTSELEEEFAAVLDKVRNRWRAARPEIIEIVTLNDGLNRTRYRMDRVPVWIDRMDNFAESSSRNLLLFNGFEKFTSSIIKSSVRKGKSPPDHEFFEQCETLMQLKLKLQRAFDRRLLGLRAELFQYAERELRSRKMDRNLQSFDDLLLNLKRALEDDEGNGLKKAIGNEFKAALIDEFQDTDPVQYGIFKRLFGGNKSCLFLIGDPKQAIYGFRGADIFTYIDAASDVQSSYTMGKNWRSEPGLVSAVNAIFSRADLPFVYDQIQFKPLAPEIKGHSQSLIIDGKSEPSFHLWFLNKDDETESGKAISKGRARELIIRSLAAEISEIIGLGREGRIILGEKALVEGDIAVLVRTNAEAKMVQKALSEIPLPSVLFSTGNLFDSNEAMEIERVLGGIINPNDERSIKAALSTDIIGIRGEDFDCSVESESLWETWPGRFTMYHELWRERGFVGMFRQLLIKENVLERLMSLPGGERSITNLLHLSEILHRISVEKKLGMTGLLKWLCEQRSPDMARSEEHQLRLESDDNAVKIVTIHKSKGLEYPIVFCPFSWDGSMIKNPKEPFAFHDEKDNMRLTIDLGSDERDTNLIAYEKEALAENLRLLYVALTRAKNRCYLAWGRFKDAETSSISYLLHQGGPFSQAENTPAVSGHRFNGMEDQDMISDLNDVSDAANGSIKLSKMPIRQSILLSPLVKERPDLSCRRLSRLIDRTWRISSYSSLISGISHFEEIPDRDGLNQADAVKQKVDEESIYKENYKDIFSFPKGTRAGIFLHDILERLDFSSRDPVSTGALVAERLAEYGYEPEWQEPVCRMIENVILAPLDPCIEGFDLSHLGKHERLNELEFYFPLKRTTPEKLRDIFLEHSTSNPAPNLWTQIEHLVFEPTRGFMRGFIDLVFKWNNRFYLVDWKSNFLGESFEAYDQKALSEVMNRELYVLQYHLYTLALDQHLRVRMPGYRYEENFGGVFYVFLRGVHPETAPHFGVYRDIPSPDLINHLRKDLIEENSLT